MKKNNVPIGRLLIQLGYINESNLAEALELQKRSPSKKLGDIIVEMGLVSEADMKTVIKEKLDVPLFNLDTYSINDSAIDYVPEELARKYTVFPIDIKDNTIALAMDDPLDYYSLEDIRVVTGKDILPVLATKSQIKAAIDRRYSAKRFTSDISDITKKFDDAQTVSINDDNARTEERIDNAPIVKLVNSIVGTAYTSNASDIHIEPTEDALVIRMRIDGDLTEMMRLNMSAHSSLIARLKIISNLNIAEKRVPQDGQFRFILGSEKVDIRISVIPTVNGEKVVLRLLSTREQRDIRGIDKLGLTEKNLALYRQLLLVPHGVILLTGPTGSGKSTTLYSTLSELNRPDVNITTVEDPVEKGIPGINQVQVNVAAGLTFAAGLRSILRQDPDIIMIGEIRDSETAEIAVRSAVTGHKVFSTLHTNDAVSSISRLEDMGIEPYLVASSLTGVVAQRLVKTICPNCKKEYTPSEADLALLGRTDVATVWRGEGCSLCGNTGYRGRTVVHEIMPIDETIRHMILSRAPEDEIEKYNTEHYTHTLRQNIADMIVQGITTIDELVKVTYKFG